MLPCTVEVPGQTPHQDVYDICFVSNIGICKVLQYAQLNQRLCMKALLVADDLDGTQLAGLEVMTFDHLQGPGTGPHPAVAVYQPLHMVARDATRARAAMEQGLPASSGAQYMHVWYAMVTMVTTC